MRVRNDGDERWPWTLDLPPPFRLRVCWHGDGEEPEGRAGFPRDIPPGEERIVPVGLVAPGSPGRWTLELSVLLEDVRWFGAPCRLEARVS